MAEGVDRTRHPLPQLRGAAPGLVLSTGPPRQRRGPPRQDEGQGNFHDRRRVASLGRPEAAHQGQLSTALVGPGALKRKRRGGVLGKRQEPPKPRYLVLASPALALAGRTLGEVSGARCQLAFLFRTSQPFPGLAACQARAAAALECQVTAARATLNLARAEAGRAAPDPSPQGFSRASWKHCHVNERVLDLLIESLALDPTWVKNQPGYDELRTYGAIAA